jgi:hypothetical protein
MQPQTCLHAHTGTTGTIHTAGTSHTQPMPVMVISDRPSQDGSHIAWCCVGVLEGRRVCAARLRDTLRVLGEAILPGGKRLCTALTSIAFSTEALRSSHTHSPNLHSSKGQHACARAQLLSLKQWQRILVP